MHHDALGCESVTSTALTGQAVDPRLDRRSEKILVKYVLDTERQRQVADGLVDHAPPNSLGWIC